MTTYCGYIALIGRPNVGKSTLLNNIIQQKVSITSCKPQTTWHRIIGINTINEYQFVYVDTPGIHLGKRKALNTVLNKTAKSALYEVDVIVFMIEGTRWTEEDEYILSLIKKSSPTPCILLINKVDKIADKSTLLPYLKKLSHFYNFAEIIPGSAKTGLQIDLLQQELKKFLPEGPHLFDDEASTDRSVPFLCKELLREKIFRLFGQEIPYSTAVEIESFKDEGKLVRIHALIFVNKPSQKQMIIGKHGDKLKEVATKARLEMEKIIGKKIFLHVFCKVKAGWIDDKNQLQQLGYVNQRT